MQPLAKAGQPFVRPGNHLNADDLADLSGGRERAAFGETLGQLGWRQFGANHEQRFALVASSW